MDYATETGSLPCARRAGKLERHGLRLAAEPVYPASCIKLCAAVAALRKVRRVPLGGDNP